jgi:REP element-mobilizing transposase RayT
MRDSLPGGRRRSIRLSTHDYAANAVYFLTLCTHRRVAHFGNIVNGIVRLSPVGVIVRDLWIQTADMRRGVVLDAFVIMPNHMLAILAMPEAEQRETPAVLLWRAPQSLGALVAGFKASCTSEVRRLLGTPQLRLWQRNYYERVIRNGNALENIRRYIAANPGGGKPHTSGSSRIHGNRLGEGRTQCAPAGTPPPAQIVG